MNPLTTLIESVTNVEEKVDLYALRKHAGKFDGNHNDEILLTIDGYKAGARSQSVLAECLKEACEALDWYAADCTLDPAGAKCGFGWGAAEALTKIRSMLEEAQR